jgi:hypothetical protein
MALGLASGVDVPAALVGIGHGAEDSAGGFGMGKAGRGAAVGKLKEIMYLQESDPSYKTTYFREAKHITTQRAFIKAAKHRKRIYKRHDGRWHCPTRSCKEAGSATFPWSPSSASSP